MKNIVDVNLKSTSPNWIDSFFDILNQLKDKSDEKYLALAQSAQADFFVTGNLKHFPEVVYGCTCVYSPASFQENMMS